MPNAVRLSIPNACHENWHDMTPVEKGRFCMSCQKSVVDFSTMNDQEIVRYISGISGKVCGRMHPDQVDRIMVARKESRLPWLKYFFQFTLPAFLVSLKAQSQHPNKKTAVEQVVMNFATDTLITPFEPDTTRLAINGHVFDQNGNPVQGATVVIKGTSRGTLTDGNGSFRIFTSENKKIPLVISCVGFMPLEIMAIPGTENNLLALTVQMDYLVMGDVIVTAVRKKRKTKKAEHAVAGTMRSTIDRDAMRLFPNPLVAGGNMNMELHVKDAGKYSVEISDLSGRIVMNEPAYINSKQTRFTINTSQLLPGGYFVAVRDGQGKNVGVKKIIVQ